jgi:hypothetical protein
MQFAAPTWDLMDRLLDSNMFWAFMGANGPPAAGYLKGHHQLSPKGHLVICYSTIQCPQSNRSSLIIFLKGIFFLILQLLLYCLQIHVIIYIL